MVRVLDEMRQEITSVDSASDDYVTRWVTTRRIFRSLYSAG